MDLDLDINRIKVSEPTGTAVAAHLDPLRHLGTSTIVEVECVKCGVTFHAKRSTAKYCSQACRQAAYMDRPAADPDRQCVECGTPIGHLRADALACSDACRAASNRWMRSPEAAALAEQLFRS